MTKDVSTFSALDLCGNEITMIDNGTLQGNAYSFSCILT